MHEAKPPLPLASTLADIQALNTAHVDLSAILPPEEKDTDATLQASYQFVNEARQVLAIAKQGRVDKEGEKVEKVRQGMEELVAGLTGSSW
jgi:hypothetical protein